MMWHDVMYIKASTQCDGSFLVAFVQGNVRLVLLFFPPSPPPSRVACDIYVMADFILVEAVSEADGCSGLLMWTLVCACDSWCICFLVVELVFLWVFFQSFPPMVFFTSVFFPCEDVGRHPLKSNSCVPPALVICVWCGGVCDGSFLRSNCCFCAVV